MALSNAERQRAYRARKRGEAEASLEARVKALGQLVSGLEVSVRALEGRLRAVEDRPVPGVMPFPVARTTVVPPTGISGNGAMGRFLDSQVTSIVRPQVEGATGIPQGGPRNVTPPVDDWEPA